MKKNITLQKIARLAGVNPSTVSRAMNPATANMISAERRERIQAICKKHSYRPRLSARAMATGKTYHVALILGAIEQDFSNPLFAWFSRGLCGALQSQGYTLSVLWAGRPESSTDHETAAFLESNVADGYVLGASMLGSSTRNAARSCGRPVVVLNPMPSLEGNGDFINLTRFSGDAYRAAWRDVPFKSYQRVAFFGMNSPNSTYKFNEIQRVAPEGARCEAIFFDTRRSGFSFDIINAEEAAELQMARLRQFEVFFCSSDLTAMGLAKALRRDGREVGRDVMLVGFDGMETTIGIPSFSTIATPWEEAGNIAVQTLLEHFDAPETAMTIPFQCRYIPRSQSEKQGDL